MRQHNRYSFTYILLFLLIAVARSPVNASFLLNPQTPPAISSFSFEIEYPGRTNAFPTKFYTGAAQSNAFLLIVTEYNPGKELTIIPSKKADISCCFNEKYLHIDITPGAYSSLLWIDNDIPEERNNSVKTTVDRARETLVDYFLNLGLQHAAENISPPHNEISYENIGRDVKVEARLLYNQENGLIASIIAETSKISGINSYSWNLQYTTSGNKYDGYVLFGSSKTTPKRELFKVRINWIEYADKLLQESAFLVPQLEQTNNYSTFTKWVYSTNALYTFHGDQVVKRMEPNDPRILQPVDRNQLLRQYSFISIGILATIGGLGYFIHNTRNSGK
jgi:hypothetical protein